MYKTTKIIIPLLAILLLAGTSHAATQWHIDPAHSGIHFGVKHIFSTVYGFFEDFEGTTYFDPDRLEDSRFDFSVKVKSVNTRNRKRDGHLRSNDFFGVNTYPEMTFKSTRIKHRQGNQYVVEGNMTIKDVTKPVAIMFTFWGIQDNPFNPNESVAGFDARFTIDRLAYGVGDGKFVKMGIVGREVDVVISTEMTRKK